MDYSTQTVASAFYYILGKNTGIRVSKQELDPLPKVRHSKASKHISKSAAAAETAQPISPKTILPVKAKSPSLKLFHLQDLAASTKLKPFKPSFQPNTSSNPSISITRRAKLATIPFKSAHTGAASKTDSNLSVLLMDVVHPPWVIADQLSDTHDIIQDAELDPWENADFSWSDEALALKEQFLTHIRKQDHSKPDSQFSLAYINKHFKTLRLHGQGIKVMDASLSKFICLEELSLTGNLISTVQNIPESVKVLHLNANKLDQFPKVSHLKNLLHLGISYNTISTVSHPPSTKQVQSITSAKPKLMTSRIQTLKGLTSPTLHAQSIQPSKALTMLLKMDTVFPLTIVSLDLAWNNLCNLEETVNHLKVLPLLKILSLQGNPLCMVSAYPKYVTCNIPNLAYLDEKEVPKSALSQSKTIVLEHLNISTVRLGIALKELTGVIETSIVPSDNPEQPPDEYKYFIQIDIPNSGVVPVESVPVDWATPEININYSYIVALPFTTALRDSFQEGIIASLHRRRMMFIPCPSPKDDIATSPHQIESVQTGKDVGAVSASTQDRAKGPAKKSTDKPGKNSAGSTAVKGKKAPKTDTGAQWMATPAETTVLGTFRTSLRALLCGQSQLSGHYQFELPVQKETPVETQPVLAGILHAEFTLNPNTDEHS
ncbi:hypothetical protein BDV3_005292 [Batrachochytrium dendrobatidis]